MDSEESIDRSGKIDEIKIFGTEQGVNVIDSPIKIKILSLLRDEELNGSNIVSLTGKSKSTISAHLKDLIKAGIVDYKIDPVDNRKKIYFIKSRYLGTFSRDSIIKTAMEDFHRQDINSDDPFMFYKNMLMAIRISLMEEGINIDPILHNAGLKVGKKFTEHFENPTTEKLIENLAEFWKKNELGHMEAQSLNPLVINVTDCFECKDLPIIGKSACAFDSGVLEAIFSHHFKKAIIANEVKCYARGDDYCCFEIYPINTA